MSKHFYFNFVILIKSWQLSLLVNDWGADKAEITPMEPDTGNADAGSLN